MSGSERDAGDEPVHVIMPPNTLKWKVTGGSMKRTLSVDPDVVKRAEAQLAHLSGPFCARTAEDLDRLDALYARYQSGELTAAAALAAMGENAIEIAGQAGTFGYPLLTVSGSSLFRLSRRVTVPGRREMMVARLHIDAMRAVLRETLTGSGGKKGEELRALLRHALERL